MSARGLGQPEGTQRGQGEWERPAGEQLPNQPPSDHLTRPNTLQGPSPWGPSAQSCEVGIFNSVSPVRKEVIYTMPLVYRW